MRVLCTWRLRAYSCAFVTFREYQAALLGPAAAAAAPEMHVVLDRMDALRVAANAVAGRPRAPPSGPCLRSGVLARALVG